MVNGEEFEAGAGDILVIKAGEAHSFNREHTAKMYESGVRRSFSLDKTR